MNPILSKDWKSNPTSISIQRSKFSRNSDLKTTFNQGQLIPIYVDEVLPGDTFSMDTSLLCRMTTPIYPVMDNADLDIFWFFVPNRLVWQHWREFCGENTSGPWSQTTIYSVPQLKFDTNNGTMPAWYGAGVGTLSNYLGIPSYMGYPNLTVSDLPNRAYRLIWNEFFRDENLQSPVVVYTDDTSRSFSKTGYGGEVLKVCKLHDYFTSCLPNPQKGAAVNVPLGNNAPVVTGLDHDTDLGQEDLRFRVWGANPTPSITGPIFWHGLNTSADPKNFTLSAAQDLGLSGVTGSTVASHLAPRNLWADLSQATSITINALRQAFAVQRLLERDARGGTRYRELLLSHFGVLSPDSRVQVPEYLGGCRVPINIDQVLQTSSTTTTSPQGNTAAYSMTTHRDSAFTKSFTEHGILMGLACVRVEHSYSQGLERFWRRQTRFDFYWPALANLGEQAVMASEVYCNGNNMTTPFGYNEAWADYRYKPNRLSGAFSEDQLNGIPRQSSLAKAWTYSDYYTSTPTLGSTFVTEPDTNVQNTLAVPAQPQFLLNIYFKLNCVRPMPLYSVPGLIDHY